MILIILVLNIGCKRENITVAESQEFSKEYIKAAISTDDISLTEDFVSRQGSKEEYVQMALEANSLEVLSFLLESNFKRNDLRESPYFYARSKEAFLLLERAGYSPNVKNYTGESLAEYYFKSKDLEFFKYFLRNSKQLNLSSEKTLPFQAIHTGDFELISLMMQRGADFTLLDKEGNYPIYYTEKEEIISLLLTLPYKVEQQNRRKEEVLGEVYLRLRRKGNTKLAEKCLLLGVDPKYRSYQLKR